MPLTILCVHQDPESCALFSEALEAEGHQLIPARDGGQALAILRKQRPDFIVLDVYLPRQDGFEILATLRALPTMKDLPVLLLSEGDVTTEMTERARSLGAIGVQTYGISAAKLVTTVARYAKAEVVAASNPSGSIPQKGGLAEWPLPELLHALHVDSWSGVLVLEHGKKKKAIEFKDGWPVSVRSNLVSECLGNYLVKAGKVSKQQMAESVERMRAGEGLQGEILVAMDVLEEEDVVEALEDHAREKLYEIFSWPDGSFSRRAGRQVQRGASIRLEGHPSKLIVEGIRRYAVTRRIDRFIADRSSCFLVPRSDDSEQMARLDLSGEEAKWFESLDGSMPVSTLVDEPEEIRKLAYALLSVELLDAARAAGNADDARRATSAAKATGKQPAMDSQEEERLRIELASMANAMQGKDHYSVLGLSPDAGDAEVEEAFQAAAKRADPERFLSGGASVRQLASQVFDRLEEARRGLASAEARQSYAEETSRGQKMAVVEQEGRRALQAETAFQRGEAMVAKRDYEGALMQFGKAMESFPSEGEYRSHYGWALYLCHPDNEVMLEEALEHCREGVRLAKDREKTYLLLGRLYKAMGKAAAAKKMFTRAVQIKPQCVEAMRELRIMNMRSDKEKGVIRRLFRR